MGRRDEIISFGCYDGHYGWHKGFYNDGNPDVSLSNVSYTEFFDIKPEDVNFAYDDAYYLLRGSCHIFALSLSKILGYTPYIIESKDKKGFHAFCQVVRRHQLFYVDARGLTTSFDEFMSVAKDFVSGEWILLGQLSLTNILMRQPNEALRQRITVNYQFGGLQEKEALEYINRQMELVGASGRILDENAALVAYGSCGGSIRKLNLILTKSLMIGAQNLKQNIDADMVLSAVNDIELC